MEKNRVILPGILVSVLFVALPGIQCNKANCESLRDELHAEKLSWQTCEVDEDCIKIGGNNRDCTGVLSCDLSVNRASRLTAERRIASLPEETVDCVECASPNCVNGEISLCERVSKRCIIVTRVIEPEPNEPTDPNAQQTLQIDFGSPSSGGASGTAGAAGESGGGAAGER